MALCPGSLISSSLPRRLIIPILKGSRNVWPKKAVPDWHLLNRRQFASMFEDAQIREEEVAGAHQEPHGGQERATRAHRLIASAPSSFG
ncbi:MAG: hypothetical protein ABI821_01175 [Pseudomonadota bacterium]